MEIVILDIIKRKLMIGAPTKPNLKIQNENVTDQKNEKL